VGTSLTLVAGSRSRIADKQVSDFNSRAENLTRYGCNKENRYVAPIKVRKDSGKSNKRNRQMDIEEPLKGEFFLFAPKITEKHIQPKGKNTYQYNSRPPGGKIHSSKYLNCPGPVKLSGPFALTFHFVIL
jgi:hypothetical protein